MSNDKTCALCGAPAVIKARGVEGVGRLATLRLLARRWVWLCEAHNGEQIRDAVLGRPEGEDNS